VNNKKFLPRWITWYDQWEGPSLHGCYTCMYICIILGISLSAHEDTSSYLTWEHRKQINLLQTCSLMIMRDQHCNCLTSALYSNFLTSEIIVSLKKCVFYCLKIDRFVWCKVVFLQINMNRRHLWSCIALTVQTVVNWIRYFFPP
jgi:hypothetical protein